MTAIAETGCSADTEAGMALERRGEDWYGERQADVAAYLQYFSSSYTPTRFADAACACSNRTFTLVVDDTEDEKAAAWTCATCGATRAVGNGIESPEARQ